MELCVLPPFSVFVVDAYVQHAGAKYHGHQNLCSHSYFDSDDIRLLEAIYFGHSGSLPISDLQKSINEPIPSLSLQNL